MQRLILSLADTRPPGVPSILRCQYNPEDLTITHAASLDARTPPLSQSGTAPLPRHAGPGQTLILVNLLFEAEADPVSGNLRDVREQTRALHLLAHRPGGQPLGMPHAPYMVDLIWGRSLARQGCIARLSERLDQFDHAGVALRSWIALEFVAQEDTAQGGAALGALPGLRPRADSVSGMGIGRDRG